MALQKRVVMWVNERGGQRVVPSTVLDVLSLRCGIHTVGSISYGPLLYFLLNGSRLARILAAQKKMALR